MILRMKLGGGVESGLVIHVTPFSFIAPPLLGFGGFIAFPVDLGSVPLHLFVSSIKYINIFYHFVKFLCSAIDF
ncbi:hypothetical protein ES703_103440 [subsurface metagenome]